MKNLLKLIDVISHAILITFVFVVVFIAVASSLLRYYSPNINQYREGFLEQINARNNIVITAKEIQSEWNLFQPKISLYGVSVKSNKLDEDLYLEKLQIKLNFIKSLLHQKLYFDFIELSNMDILLIEDEKGKWSFANLEKEDREKQNLTTVLNRLWAIDELVMQNIHLSLWPYKGTPVHLPNLMARITTYKNEKHFSFQLNQHSKQVGLLIVNTKNDPMEEDFKLKGYVKINNYSVVDLVSLIPEMSLVKQGSLSNELWFYWRPNQSAFSGRLAINDLVLNKNKTIVKLDSVKTTLFGTYTDEQFLVESPKSLIQSGQNNYSLGPTQLRYKEHFHISAKRLNLGDVYKFSRTLPISEELKIILDSLSPRGILNNVHAKFGKNVPFDLRAELHNVSVSAWNGAPEILSINGYMQVAGKSGFVEFDTHDLSMYFPHLYEKPMLFDKAKGYVDWHIGQDAIYVNGKDLFLEAKSGLAHGEFGLSLPTVKSGHYSPRLSLNIGMKNTAASYKNIFIPNVVSKNLVDWLEKNIQEGEFPEVAFIYHGPTQNESNEHRVIQLWLTVKDAILTYADQWPAIEKINGEFLLDDKFGYAHVKDAKTEELLIKKAEFQLSPSAEGELINVKAEAEGLSGQVLSFLKGEVLANQMDHVIDQWTSDKGKITAIVDVSTQLAASVSTKVNVSSSLDTVNLSLPQQNILVRNISGPVNFNSDEGLTSSGIVATFLGKPVTAKIVSRVNEEKSDTSIQMQGQVDATEFAKWSGQPLVNFLSGAAVFNAEVYYGSAGSGLRIGSDLKGLQVNLPKPFIKKAKSKRDFTLHFPFSGESREVDIVYGEGINAHFMLGENGVDSGVINLGLNKGQYEMGKVILGGQVLEVDSQEWLDVIARYKELMKGNPLSQEKQSLVFVVENLQIKKLKAYDEMLDSVSFDLFNTVSYWQLGIDHKDLKATLKIYEDEQPMDLHLHRVNLEFLSKKQQESGVGYANKSLSNFPDIDVTIDKLISSGEDFGEWEFKVRSYQDYMALENMQASFKAMRLTSDTDDGATLYWTFGEHPKTHFKGKFVSDNIAQVLKSWGYKQEINSEKAEFKVVSSWDGVPTDFEFNNIIAETQLKMEKGNFSDVSSTSTDALKFIGIFNITNLVKRLQLDFSDLTSQGLSYDTVFGVISSDHGVYHFDQPMVIKSSASKIRLYGGFDMNTKTLDMTMGVTLPLASNLPWIVGLAAGLPTAAGIYIISKVLNKQVDKISSAVYTVTGAFEDPQIKFSRLFDTEEDFEKQNINPSVDNVQSLDVKPETLQ